MEVGIVGLPLSGKTTLFSTLTGQTLQTAHVSGKIEVHRGIVKVPDARLDRLTEIFKPRKQVNATIEYIEVGGIEKDAGREKGFDSQMLQVLKNTSALCVVVRDFENELYPHPEGSVDPVRDFRTIETEFLLSDLAIVENRIERLEKQLLKEKSEKGRQELELMKKCLGWLEAEKPLRELSFSEAEELLLRGYQFLSAKPIVVVLNISEGDIAREKEILAELAPVFQKPGIEVVALCAKIEQEISQLDESDAREFLKDLGIEEPALPKLIKASFNLLGLISFFTVGEDECRAWTIRKGTTVQTAAGVIHSDMERGFIRAEVVSYEDFIQFGSLARCREKGLLRLEGKQYQVRDGDIVTIRFNV